MMSARSRPRERLDLLLVARGLAATRAKAQALVLAGRVFSRGERLDKPGTRHPTDLPLELRGDRRYVGRGAYKLLHALRAFRIDASGRDALDVGASTGGFTQVLLEQGARRVIALDVGRGQLDWSLRSDPRIIPLEGVNARHLAPGDLPFPPSLATIDVSFISLELVLAPVAACLTADGEIVALVKPQFEVGRGQVGKGGIVREPSLHRDVLERVARFVRARGWSVAGLCASPVLGADGNREFLLHVLPGPEGLDSRAVEEALVRAVSPAEESEQ